MRAPVGLQDIFIGIAVDDDFVISWRIQFNQGTKDVILKRKAAAVRRIDVAQVNANPQA